MQYSELFLDLQVLSIYNLLKSQQTIDQVFIMHGCILQQREIFDDSVFPIL